MRKVFLSTCVMALMAFSSALIAQEAESTLEAEAAETVEAVAAEASAPAEEEAVVDAQVSVSDGVALESAVVPIASGVIVDPGFVVGGGCCGQPVQTFDSCCSPTPCCGDSSFVQPVVFNQPIFDETTSQAVPAIQASATSIVNPAPAPVSVYSQPATTYSQPIYSQPATTVTPGCSSCSGGGVVNYAPAATTYSPTPAATTFSSAPVTSTPVTSTPITSAPLATSFTSAPAATSFVSAPTAGCAACAQAAPAVSSDCCCQQQSRGLLRSGGLFRNGGFMQRGISSRLRGAAVGEIIDN